MSFEESGKYVAPWAWDSLPIALTWKVPVALLAVVLYGGVFIASFSIAGASIAAMIVLPVATVAWLYGMKAGIAAGVLAIPYNMALLEFVGADGLVIVGTTGAPGVAATILVGVLVGRLHDLGVSERALRRKMERQNVVLEREIDERERAQKALVRLAAFPEFNPSPVIEMDYSGRVLNSNPAARERFPDLPEKGLDHPLLEDLKATLPRLPEGARESIAGEVDVGGATYDRKVSLIPKTQSVMVYTHDITERKRAEHALRQSEQLLAVRNKISEIFLTHPDEAVYEEVLDCVLEATESEHGVFGYIDENGALVMASWSREIWSQCQVPGKEMVIPHDTWNGLWGRALMEKRALSANGDLNVPEGHIPISRAMVEPIRHGDGIIGMFMVGNKATDYDDLDREKMETIGSHLAPILNTRLERDREERMRRLAQEAEARYSQELERSNAELEQFAYVASHDLQEPLRMVASYVQLLERRYRGKLDSDADEFIEYAADGAKRMQRLIRDLLTYSRVSTKSMEFKPTDCESVLEDALKNLEVMRQESGAEVTNDALPTLEADHGQLVQLFQNLISNGIKFHGEEPPRIHITAENGGEGWVFSVRDNGIGIDEEYADRIFAIFQRLHDRTEYPGTGIGLAVCRRIVERHNGRIWLESEPGEGSTFHFTLPVNRGVQT